MSRIKYLLTLGVIITIAIAFTFSIFDFGEDRSFTPEKFREYKFSQRKGEPSKKPTEWFTVSRAYPHDHIPYQAYKAALDRARDIYNASVSLDVFPCAAVGPYNVGGRITALAADPSSPGLIYAGAALGGVFKSMDYGESWEPVSDDVPSLSVGDIAIDPTDSDVLYFGTGEANSSGDSYDGTGLYRTTDGGLSWEFLGLSQSHHIGRIAIDPIDNQKIFVACMGSLFSTNPERGLYRSSDGGEIWEQVLSVNDSTGCIDVVINPDNTDIIYAAMWQRIRSPHRRRVGGIHCGIYRSINGGDDWELLSNGLPAPHVNNGRIGLAIAPSNPDIVYASYVNHPGSFMGVWRSIDGGDSWQSRLEYPNTDEFSGFGWYFGQIWVHPNQENTVYLGDVDFWRSTDGGAHFYESSGSMHVDHHALYQDPVNPDYIINGNDGGVFISQNEGGAWYKLYDLPITQFYAITIDKLNPVRLYGGTQDNSTPRTIDGMPDDWDIIFYGDGFYTNVDFTNSNVIYAEAQYGYLGKTTNLGGSWSVIFSNYDHGERTNWNTPVVMSPHDNQVLFYGAQRVFQTSNGGGSFTPISPDLTGGSGGGELMFGTITTISQSPLNPDIIWAGTDDSRVWVTDNGGNDWLLVSDSLPNRWCTRVTADVFDEAAAYVTLSGYKEDDMQPHIYKTEDYGMIWYNISGNLEGIPVNDILPDPQQADRLYIGTDFGMFYTGDGGVTWEAMSPDHPICPVFDIDLHNDTRKLVSGTHGRSMYAFDLSAVDIPETDNRPLSVSLNQNYPNPFNAGTNISFEIKTPSQVELKVFDAMGRLVSTLIDKHMDAGEHILTFDGSSLASGNYFVSLKADGVRLSRKMALVK